MPKSKRSKLVSLTKVAKKTKEHKSLLMNELQETSKKWKYCWLFEVGNMRNSHLSTVRQLWKGTARIFFAKGKVMAKALGLTPEEEHLNGIHKLAQQIHGQVGIMFTNSKPEEVTQWFADFQRPDFARAGNTASRTVVLPAGPVMRTYSDPPEPFPHNEEPQLRRLGLPTRMDKGVPTLSAPHKVCEKGKALTAEQAQLLKLIGERMVKFRVRLRCYWDSETGTVAEAARTEGDDDDDDDDDESSEALSE